MPLPLAVPVIGVVLLIAKDIGLIAWGFNANKKATEMILKRNAILKKIDEKLDFLAKVDDHHITEQVSVAIMELRDLRDYVENLDEDIHPDSIREYIAKIDEELLSACDSILETAYGWSDGVYYFLSRKSEQVEKWFDELTTCQPKDSPSVS